MRHKNIFLCLILMTAMLLTACGSERHVRDLKQFIEAQQKIFAQGQKPSATSQLQFPTPATYQPNNKRSPFEEASLSSASASVSANHPLEAYPLSSLQFKGTVSQQNSILAFILAPDNKLYQVKTGDIIGDHYAKIIKIYPDHIEVEEDVKENGNQTTKRLITLQLKE